MSDRWAKYTRKLEDEFRSFMPLLNITLYGSYSPDSEKQFLFRQRDFLRKKGYTKTYIVTDYPKSKAVMTDLELSISCLEFSDVNFLIFTREGKNQGVTRELTHVATSPTMADKVKFCTVFDQTRDNHGSLSPLSMNDIDNSGIGRREFKTESQLQDALSQQAYAKLKILQSTLKKRR